MEAQLKKEAKFVAEQFAMQQKDEAAYSVQSMQKEEPMTQS